jgi:ribonuclease P protein subunit POP4
MKVTPDIVRYEFIGTQARVAQSLHRDYVGVGGLVVGETRNTFALRSEGKTKSVIKESVIFNFRFGDGTVVEVDGKLLVGRPEDRLKKNMKRLW